MSSEIGRLQFDDAFGRGSVWIALRAEEGRIELTVSLDRDGDVSVWMTPAISGELSALLRKLGTSSQPGNR